VLEDNWHANVAQKYNKQLAREFKTPNKDSWISRCMAWDDLQEQKRREPYKIVNGKSVTYF